MGRWPSAGAFARGDFSRIDGRSAQTKADPARHPDAFYQGLRLCGVDGSSFSVTNTPQVKKQMRKARSRRGRAAFSQSGCRVMVELGLHNPLAARSGGTGRIGDGAGQTSI